MTIYDKFISNLYKNLREDPRYAAEYLMVGIDNYKMTGDSREFSNVLKDIERAYLDEDR